jgi:hypothetical protein
MNYTKDLCVYISTFQKYWIAQCLLSYITFLWLMIDFFAKSTAVIKYTALIIFRSVTRLETGERHLQKGLGNQLWGLVLDQIRIIPVTKSSYELFSLFSMFIFELKGISEERSYPVSTFRDQYIFKSVNWFPKLRTI